MRACVVWLVWCAVAQCVGRACALCSCHTLLWYAVRCGSPLHVAGVVGRGKVRHTAVFSENVRYTQPLRYVLDNDNGYCRSVVGGRVCYLAEGPLYITVMLRYG